MACTVFVDDNYACMDEFADCDSAVAACKRIVDKFPTGSDGDIGADELFAHYKNFGEDPWITGADGNCGFSAWTYAKERCSELAGPDRLGSASQV